MLGLFSNSSITELLDLYLKFVLTRHSVFLIKLVFLFKFLQSFFLTVVKELSEIFLKWISVLKYLLKYY